jgi:hypothetical protein
VVINDGGGSNSGHVRVYQYSNSSWTQLGSDIDGEAVDDKFGISVSLSSDGTILAIGAPYNDSVGSDSGHVRVYQYSNSSWTQLGSDIDGEAVNDNFGISVSLSGDGNTLIVGANETGTNNTPGHARIFKYITGSWTQFGSNIDGKAADDKFGHSVAISKNGRVVAIGAPNNDDSGSNIGVVQAYELLHLTNIDISNSHISGVNTITATSFIGDGSQLTGITDTTYSAGTGLSLVGTIFNNTSPDQTVTITGSGATTVTGTYPNFTITSTDTSLSNLDTDDLTEGSTNKYYSNSLVDSHLSGGTGITYSNGSISIGQSVGTSDNVQFNNLTVNGTLHSDDITGSNVTVSNDLVVIGNLSVKGNDATYLKLSDGGTVTADMIVGPTNASGVAASIKIGDVTGWSTSWAGISHSAKANGTDYALLQHNGGNVILNANGQLYFRKDNVNYGEIFTDNQWYIYSRFNVWIDNGTTTTYNLAHGNMMQTQVNHAIVNMHHGVDRQLQTSSVYGYNSTEDNTIWRIHPNHTHGQVVNGRSTKTQLLIGADLGDKTFQTIMLRAKEYFFLFGDINIFADQVPATGGGVGNLNVAGTTTSTSYVTTSDERIKTNITNANKQVAYNQVKQIQMKTYDYKDTSRKKSDYGFIAQQVETILPNAVQTVPGNYSSNGRPVEKATDAVFTELKQVDKDRLFQLLFCAFQESQVRIEALEARLAKSA